MEHRKAVPLISSILKHQITKKIAWLIGLTFCMLLLTVGIAKYGVLPHFQHKTPQGIARADIGSTLLEINFKQLTWQEALNTETVQFFDYRKPRGINISNRIDITSTPEETFEINGLHAREKTSITYGRALRPYFGNLHSHTSWSDGKGDPATAFSYAREMGLMDFMAITDHPEHWIFNSERNWSELQNIAASFTSNSFVALSGYEYSSPVFGHYIVINPKSVCSALKCKMLSEFYHWLDSESAGDPIVFFGHPLQQKDNPTSYEFAKFQPDAKARSKIKGIEVIHWGGYRHFLTGYTGTKPFLDEAIDKGWELGSVSAQDNHGYNWGTGGTNRHVLLMDGLSKENVLEALKSRRFYATSSNNIYFTAQAKLNDGTWLQMGEEVSLAKTQSKDIELVAKFFDRDADQIPHRFEWIFNGKTTGVFDFFSRDDLKEFMDSELYYAGQFTLTLPYSWLDENRLNYVYARFYQGNEMDAFTQSSPIFFRGSKYLPPVSDEPTGSW